MRNEAGWSQKHCAGALNVGGLRVSYKGITLLQNAQKGRSARPQPMKAPEAYPQGYVEDAFEARTKLADFFSILPEGGLHE
jgi:hypothetical protein